MKKLFAVLLAAAMCFVFCACGDNNDNDTIIDDEGLEPLRIGVSAGEKVPQTDVFDTMTSRTAAKGYKLELVPFESAEEANAALESKEIDVSLITQKWQFDEYSKEKPETLLNLGAVYYEPYGLYLCNYETIDEIADGATFAVPSDKEGMARALLLLENLGYIKVRDEAGVLATLDDIEENSRKFEFAAYPADKIAENITTGESDAVVMSAASAKAAGYAVNKKAVAVEDYTHEAALHYSTVLLINKEDISSQKYKDVSVLYFSPMMYENIHIFKGSYIMPSFTPNVDR